MTRRRYTLGELLAGSEGLPPLTDEDRARMDAPPVGNEILRPDGATNAELLDDDVTPARLTPHQAARIARVWAVAFEVWQSRDEARGFLFRPHLMIEDKRPIDMTIQSESRAERVPGILGRLKCGTAP
ncbi:hypothetical protein [Methylocella sp.]|uniref:hypothetical protein n=1 Tax=Methylocella sp. TaxID=1978226 RepID=UPI0035B1978C